MPINKALENERYRTVKRADPVMYGYIAAFASTFGAGDEEIRIKTRHQVESFCISLVKKQGKL